ncbi:aldehyde dehydrogenase family protein [Paenibacillus qinlingensis]|uniref:Acyl-CoA reductase-like NAD-dependent aldehyde dehydrogenase n=1 Tax=Paenibacillus qinlingensis TaxID=1837343 RepID=A0ABU1NRA6_9BACL|nr:aldehyde dehydrogenase family protein [Paenibacillus qinlingensis]MDR6550017.1 acyl-CoA reductase-like NAD-dependent aldehyde dehydrogenase [Paenibacillus qinlingensis]
MRKQLFIDGTWVEASGYRPLFSPYNGEQIAEIGYAGAAEVELAIAAAERAKSVMAAMSAHQRASILEKLAALIRENKEACARLISLEAAKPITTARIEVERTIATYQFAAEEAKRIQGETIPMDAAPGGEGRVAYTIHQPLGVVAAITPFNFPMNLVAHKVGPAIAAGNTLVLKPAGQTPLSVLFLAELMQQSGLPAGALNVVTGSGSVIGDLLVTDKRIKAATFTGSPEVGITIRNKAGLKKVILELGSNSALIVDQGVDVDAMIARAVTGAFSYAGQVCISLQRIYVHDQLFDEFVHKFVKQTETLQLGDPLDEGTDVSALIGVRDAERAMQWISEAEQLGAIVATGNKREGNIVHPTVLLNVASSASVSCQEVFAPIVMINRVSSIEEAIRLVNDSKYGLQAGIYTENIRTALAAAEALEVGGVMINDIPTFRVDHMPYGGVKESGTGREGVKYAIRELTEMKLICFKK